MSMTMSAFFSYSLRHSSCAMLCTLSTIALGGCAIQRTTPTPVPHSAMLAHAPADSLQAQHQRAQLFAEPSNTSPRKAPRKTARRTPRKVKQAAPVKKSRPLPALATRKPAAPKNPGANQLLAAINTHISTHGTGKLKGMEFTSLSQLQRQCKKLGRLDFKTLKTHDIVFFHNTHDANNDGRNNDWYTYAAIVHTPPGDTQVATLKDPTKSGKKLSLSISYPDMYTTEGGVVLNTHIRQPKKRDLPYTRYLAGELFAGACRI